MTRARTGRAAGRGGAGSPGAAARPAPGECPAGRRHLKGLRAREEACGGVTGARSELGFESGSDSTGEGAMASSGPLVPPLLLLLVLLAGAARAGLHFRPGRGCYRPLRGDRLTQLGRRSGRLVGGLPISRGCARSAAWGTLPPPWGASNQGALLPLTSAGQGQPLGFGSAFFHLCGVGRDSPVLEAGQTHRPAFGALLARAVLFLHWGWG